MELGDKEEEDKVGKKKITLLLLNTPGACFLCLKDNQTDDQDLNGGIVDLGRICRHLNINQGSLLLTSLKNDGGIGVGATGLELGQCAPAFSVNLCQKCQELTEKLNDWLIQLEKAKLMVNYHLLTFHKTLEGGNGGEDWEGSLEWINLLGRMHANPDNSFEAKLVELLREETRDKALKVLKKCEAAQPQVILSKCDADASPGGGGTSIPIPSIKDLLQYLVTTNTIPSKKSGKSKLCRCPYCSKTLNHCKLSTHLSCLHSDKLLSSIFPPLSSPPSESICREVLHSQVILNSSKIPSPGNPTALPRLGCHLCGITYSDGNRLKQHFLISHTDNLCEAITNFKKNPQKKKKTIIKTPSKITPKLEVSKTVEDLIKNLQDSSLIIPSQQDANDNTTTTKVIKKCQCPFCPDSVDHLRFPRHLANLHPDKLLAPFTMTSPALDKLKDDNPNEFSQLCGKVLATQLDKAAKVPATPAPATPGGGGGSGTFSRSKLECHLCQRIYTDGRNLKYHFLVDHTNDMLGELGKMENFRVGLQDKKKVITKVVKSMPLKENPVKIEAEEDNPLDSQPLDIKPLRKIWRRSVEEKTCQNCGQTFTQVGTLRKHLVTLHPDQLFLECKPEAIGGDQWRDICKGFFGGEVKQATFGRRGNKIYKCGYCPPGGAGGERRYKASVDLVVHLAYQHREEMEGRLRQVQGEVKVEEDGMEVDENSLNFGGDHGGNQVVVMEEEELDVKPDIGMLYPDTVLKEVISQEEMEGEDDKMEEVEELSRYFEGNGNEENGGGDHEMDDGGIDDNLT